jgi:transketolase C-terminal domain/subunit
VSDDANGPWPAPGIGLGRDDNPEQWPESFWAGPAELLNHGGAAATVVTSGYHVVSEVEVTGTLTVEPGDSAVVREAD